MATTQTTYVPLEPTLPQVVGGNLSFDANQVSTMSSVISTLFVLMVSLCLVAALVMCAYAGLLFVKADSTNEIAEARNVLKKSIFGIIGVFVMYLLLNQINPNLLKGDIGFTKLDGAVMYGGSGGTSGGGGATGQATGPDSAIRSELNTAGITFNHNNQDCTDSQWNDPAPSCTSVLDLPRATIDVLKQLKKDCGCTVQITGGTENGHKTHGRGSYPVDLGCSGGSSGCSSDDLTRFIKSNGGSPGVSGCVGGGDCATPACFNLYSYGGFSFCNEKPRSNASWGPHWHIYK